MAHIVFVESNSYGLQAFGSAKKQGHIVTFVYSPNHSHFYGGDPTDPSFAHVDRLFPIPNTMDVLQLTEALRLITREASVDAVITVLDYCVEPLAEACQTLGLPFTPLAAVRAARNKALMREILHQAGVEKTEATVLRPSLVDTWAKFPAVLKPASGGSSYCAVIVSNPRELRSKLREAQQNLERIRPHIRDAISLNGFMLEEYLMGRMLSVEVAASQGEVHILTIGERTRSMANEVIELGTLMPASLTEQDLEAVKTHVDRALTALGYTMGMAHVEVILTANGPRIMEVNPRLMGGTLPNLYFKSHGHDIYQTLAAIHLGLPVSVPLPQPKRIAISRAFGAEIEAKANATFDLNWTKHLAPNSLDLRLSIKPGQTVAALRSNLDYAGSFTLVANNVEEAERIAGEVLNAVEDTIGIKLQT